MFNREELPKPELNIEGDNIRLEAGPHNTTLFRYIGKYAMYDHVFFSDEESDLMLRAWLYKMGNEKKDLLTMAMLAYDYPCILNQDNVAECDIQAFESEVMKPMLSDLSDEMPEEWA